MRTEMESVSLKSCPPGAAPTGSAMERVPVWYSARELSDLGVERIPDLFQLSKHLIFSSPATLAFNSPGAEGFGVKRAGLAIPDSVMLIVSPGCCGRNTSEISEMPQYRQRFFYLEMDETDLVTGRHLKAVPEAVKELAESLPQKPSLVMICATCVDALLGTDWDRVARKAEELSGVRVRPCYMYALTREGRKPPMVHVRESLYSLLEKRKRERGSVNLLGFFAPLMEDCELYRYLREAGVSRIREISRCRSYEEFETMAEASFNLCLNPECRAAADMLSERLSQPYVELVRFTDPERIHRQYQAFGKALGGEIRDLEEYEASKSEIQEVMEAFPGRCVSIGESMNGDPFEMAQALALSGFQVLEVFGSLTAENFHWIERLTKISPDTRIYCNQEPTMLYFGLEEGRPIPDFTIGKDACFYHPAVPSIPWNEDIQPFGYAGVRELYRRIRSVLSQKEPSAPGRMPTGACDWTATIKHRRTQS